MYVRYDIIFYRSNIGVCVCVLVYVLVRAGRRMTVCMSVCLSLSVGLSPTRLAVCLLSALKSQESPESTSNPRTL